MQESMGPIADRRFESLLPNDIALVKIRRLLLETLADHAAGKPLAGLDPRQYRVRSARYEAAAEAPAAETMRRHVILDQPLAAE